MARGPPVAERTATRFGGREVSGAGRPSRGETRGDRTTRGAAVARIGRSHLAGDSGRRWVPSRALHRQCRRVGCVRADRAPGATHCHRYGWRDVMERVFGHDCVYLAARTRAGALDGVLPLVRVKSSGLRSLSSLSMPFLNYGGPVGSDRAVSALVSAAAGRARRETQSRWSSCAIVRRWRQAPGGDWTASTRKITVVLDMPVARRRAGGRTRRSGRRSTASCGARCGGRRKRA